MSTIKIESRKKNIKVEFGVESIPGKKNRALIKMRGAHIEILGYFNNNEHADEFDKILNIIVEAFNEKD